MKEYTWDTTDSGAATIRISQETVPGRAALTATAIVVERDASMKVLLVDPHPKGTWDTWMFPYASLVLNKDDLQRDIDRRKSADAFLSLRPNSSLAEVAAAIDALRVGFQPEYRRALEMNINNMIPHVVADWSGEPFYVSYSLKYSRTSNSYTIYRFDYYERRAVSEQIGIDHIWVEPHQLLTTGNDKVEIEGRPVEDSDPVALRKLLSEDKR